MPRFVILEHDHPTRHWDFMLEAGPVLRTWRLSAPPEPGRPVAAVASFDHRLIYLEYEGPVSGNRGIVRRWDAGTFAWEADTADHIAVRIGGQRLRGQAILQYTEPADWSLTVRVDSPFAKDETMDALWAPWRLSYVASARPPVENDCCFICQGLAEDDDRRNLIALRTPRSVVVLNRFPYNNGHLLVAPRQHKGKLHELDADELLETMESLRRMVGVLDGLMQPAGYNIGLNLGLAAGAGLPGHLHWHIVPRWHGDTNFMPVLSDTKVIVQSLDALYDLLTARLREGTASCRCEPAS